MTPFLQVSGSEVSITHLNICDIADLAENLADNEVEERVYHVTIPGTFVQVCVCPWDYSESSLELL